MCKIEWDEMQEAKEAYGEESEQYKNALGKYLLCMEAIYDARASHGLAWDERLYRLQQEIQEAWERSVGRLKIPPVPTCGKKSIEVRSKIFLDRNTAMTFSEKLEEAFSKTGIQLDGDETYACLVCVVKKPQYVSEALVLDPLGQKVQGAPRVNYIMEPAIMEPVMDVIEQDRIEQKNKGR